MCLVEKTEPPERSPCSEANAGSQGASRPCLVPPAPSSLHLRLLVEPSVTLHSESEVPRVGKVLDTAASAKILPIKSVLKHKKLVENY